MDSRQVGLIKNKP